MNHALAPSRCARNAALAVLSPLVLAGAASAQCDPTVIGWADTPDSAYGVTVSGTLSYIADLNRGLQVIDVSDPVNPWSVGEYDTPGDARGVTVSGTLAYVADGNVGLQVIDVSNPASPVLIGSFNTPGLPATAYDVAVSGTVAYLAEHSGGLHLIDVSDPTSPTLLSTVGTANQARGVVVAGTLAYVADGSAGLRVIDVSDPTSPVILGTADTPNAAYDVDLSGDTAYVADFNLGLQVIDVSDPTSPIVIGAVDTTGKAHGVAVEADRAYVADHDPGVVVVDISDPTNPQIIGSINTPGQARGIAVLDDVVHVASIEWGLQLVEGCRCEPTQPVMTLTSELVDPVTEGWDADGYDASAYDTHRVYATFDLPVSVGGVGDAFADGIQFQVSLSSGQFHNDAMGADTPPNSALVGSFPTLEWDTFVTIGEPTGLAGDGSANTKGSPDFAAQVNGLDAAFALDGEGWYVTQFPAHADSVLDVDTGSERVLIAQFTVDQGEQVTGTNWRVSANVCGQSGVTYDLFADFVTPDPCPADFGGNNAVKFEDLTQLVGQWGACPGCIEDIDGDGFVGFSDLTMMLEAWGGCP